MYKHICLEQSKKKILQRALFCVNICNQILPFVRLNIKSSSSNRHAFFDHEFTSKESIQFNVCPPTLLPARYANIQIKIILNQSAQKINIFIAGINVDE